VTAVVDLDVLGSVNDAMELAMRIRDTESIRLSGVKGADLTNYDRAVELVKVLRVTAILAAQPWLDEHPEVKWGEVRELLKLVREDQGL
jgi:hypothetical protein